MAQANEKPDKTHDKLTKELNKLKIDLNNEGNMDTDLTKRQLRSRMIVVPTPRVLNASQMATVIPLTPNPIALRKCKFNPHIDLISQRMKVLTRTLKPAGLELPKAARLAVN